ncbi:hypothetical protein QBC44DRAFT_299081 [Cladorrhinum sp. PSN332]|nr:hypothetical protein QBC44DRAFT_299081 [Cladorrhinum sp. PSN332]
MFAASQGCVKLENVEAEERTRRPPSPEFCNDLSSLPRLSHRNWYQTGVDFCYYAPAQEACSASKDRLEKLRLQDDELRFSRPDQSIKPREIFEKLVEIQDEMERKANKRSGRVSEFIYQFAAFAEQASSLVMVLLPESPEYKVTFGMIFLLFKAVVTQRDREEALTELIKSISQRLPVAEFYKTVFPTNSMKAAVARIYACIMKILDEALVYFRGWRLNKLVDALLNNRSKFQDLIDDLEVEYKTMQELKDASHVAQTADMMDVVSDTNRIVTKLYENFHSQTLAISMSMEILHSKMHSLTIQTNSMINFEVTKHSRALQEILLGTDMDASEELELILGCAFQLSPKDHWENNGALAQFQQWSETARDLPLWICGTSGPNQDSWVTEMSIDIIHALQPQIDITLLHAFCDEDKDEGRRLTAIGLVKRLLAQLLELHPELAYKHPDICNTWRFQKSDGSFSKVWGIFEQLVARIPNLFIVVDRVDGCEGDERAGVMYDLLPALMGMPVRLSEATVIVTSIYDPPELDTPLCHLYVDTRRSRDSRGGKSW